MRAGALVLLFSALAIVAAGIIEAQTPSPPTVRWHLGAANSDWIVRNGLEIVMLAQNGLTVKVALTVRQPRHVALIDVTNETDQRIELVPSRITLDLVEPENKSFPYLDPDGLAASVRRASIWSYVFLAMASMGTQQSHTTGTVGNVPVNVTTTTHDQAREDRAIEAVARNQQHKATMASDIERGALHENTLLPGENVGGAVFFGTPKRYQKDFDTGKLQAVLNVPVGNYVFEFPFWWKGILPTNNNQQVVEHPFEFPLWWKARE